MKLTRNKEVNVNHYTYMSYLARLSLLAKSMFKWEGLPEGCNERYLEKSLYEHGQAVFYYDKEYGFINLKANPTNIYNIYGEPVGIEAVGENGFMRHLDSTDEFVFIRNNDECYPTFATINLYAMRLAEIERTADVNIKAQKTPLVILCDNKQQMTFRNLYQQYDGNMPVIFGDKNLNMDNIKVIKTDAPFIANDLLNYKHDIWNECMTFLGLNNANVDKKERLITNEVESNNEQVEAMRNIMLKCREQACKEINDIFGLNVSVRLRTSEETLYEVSECESESEEVNIG